MEKEAHQGQAAHGGPAGRALTRLGVTLAFVCGYALTVGPVMRSGLPLRAAVRMALAADTVSIVTMEVVDNGIMLLIPGAMDSGLASPLLWGWLAVALAIAFVVTVPVNRALIGRGSARGQNQEGNHIRCTHSVCESGCPVSTGQKKTNVAATRAT